MNLPWRPYLLLIPLIVLDLPPKCNSLRGMQKTGEKTVINIWSGGFETPNGAAFVMPLIKFRRALKNAGHACTIFYKVPPTLTNCDYLFIDSKVFKHHWAQDFDGTLERITTLNEHTKVIWCDTGDSTGTFLGQVLPHVHHYLKAQVLRDKREYMREHHASRIWAEYYHQNYGVTDDEPYLKHLVKNPMDLEKIGVSWNSGMMHYGVIGPYLQHARHSVPVDSLLHFSKRIKGASDSRSLDMTCRMGIPYSRPSMRYQREQVREKLKDHLPTDKLARRAYFAEMADSKICLSPFGLGEITLKDFECFLTGAALLKPDMSHMDTWPNVYEKDVTYIAHDWDLDTLQERIDWALSYESERFIIAQEGQDRYCRYTCDAGANEHFVNHFQDIIDSF
jgi:hypothetical protein